MSAPESLDDLSHIVFTGPKAIECRSIRPLLDVRRIANNNIKLESSNNNLDNPLPQTNNQTNSVNPPNPVSQTVKQDQTTTPNLPVATTPVKNDNVETQTESKTLDNNNPPSAPAKKVVRVVKVVV